jgi:glutathione synthase/RimK-type ligase-like ATP-grasp enzyme
MAAARLCLLTPHPAENSYSAVGLPEFQARLTAPLEAASLVVETAPWSGPLPPADAYAPLFAWGYHRRWRAWLETLDAFASTGARVINPVPTLRWNGDKAYLLELAERGAPLPPTVGVDHATSQAVEIACEGFGAEEVVVKPRISGGSFQTVRVRRGEPLVDRPEGPALIQPFLPAVAGEGEWSLFFFGDAGGYSHGLTKVAAAGDFRVQPQFGGRVEGRPAPDAAMRAGQAVLHACPHPWIYARVDLIADGNGGYSLMELELIEPHLFLDQAEDGGVAFARAMKAAVAG